LNKERFKKEKKKRKKEKKYFFLKNKKLYREFDFSQKAKMELVQFFVLIFVFVFLLVGKEIPKCRERKKN